MNLVEVYTSEPTVRIGTEREINGVNASDHARALGPGRQRKTISDSGTTDQQKGNHGQ